MGDHSNFVECAHHVSPDLESNGACVLEARAAAAHTRRILLGRVRALPANYAGALQAAYEVRPWPAPLQDALGRATGIAVRMAATAEGLPETREALDRFERAAARRLTEALASEGMAALGDLPLLARALLRAAHLAYEEARGGAWEPTLREVL
jgi:hypothetical protein